MLSFGITPFCLLAAIGSITKFCRGWKYRPSTSIARFWVSPLQYLGGDLADSLCCVKVLEGGRGRYDSVRC